jgi:hypothetical protein
MEGAGADFHVVGLQNDTALFRPEFLQRQDQALKGTGGIKGRRTGRNFSHVHLFYQSGWKAFQASGENDAISRSRLQCQSMQPDRPRSGATPGRDIMSGLKWKIVPAALGAAALAISFLAVPNTAEAQRSGVGPGGGRAAAPAFRGGGGQAFRGGGQAFRGGGQAFRGGGYAYRGGFRQPGLAYRGGYAPRYGYAQNWNRPYYRRGYYGGAFPFIGGLGLGLGYGYGYGYPAYGYPAYSSGYGCVLQRQRVWTQWGWRRVLRRVCY